MPEAAEPQPTKEELMAITEAMQTQEVSHGAGLLLTAWRLYWLARAQMISVSKGKLTDNNFGIVSQALAKEAMTGFKVGKLKNQIKNSVLPFLKKLSAKEARLSEAKNGKPDAEPESGSAGPDATVG